MITKVKYCPYCGSDLIKKVKSVPRSYGCNTVFLVDFFRNFKPRKK